MEAGITPTGTHIGKPIAFAHRLDRAGIGGQQVLGLSHQRQTQEHGKNQQIACSHFSFSSSSRQIATKAPGKIGRHRSFELIDGVYAHLKDRFALTQT
jgi:hypothetical protein